MVFVDTGSAVWILLAIVPAIDVAKKQAAVWAASVGGMGALDSYLRGIFGGNAIAKLQDRPVSATSFAPRTRGVGSLILPQATPELRAAQRRLWESLARFGIIAVVGWVAAITLTSQVEFSPDTLRVIQAAFAIAVGLFAVREIRRPGGRSLPLVSLLASFIAAVVLMILTLTGPEGR